FMPAPAGAGLGVSVALNQDGSVLAAGAWREDGLAAEEGAVYTFTRNVANWTAVTKLVASDGAAEDRFGVSVSLSDDGVRLAVGAPGNFLGGGGFTGAAYVYTGDAVPVTDWIDEFKVIASNAEADDAFGIAVALDDNGDKLLVGASFEDGSGTGFGSTVDELAPQAGAAYLFERDLAAPPAWTQKEYIKATNTDAGDEFGTSVSMDDSGNRLVVGAQKEESLATGVNGDQTDNSGSLVGATYLWNLK
ncbi:MAG: integrin, partial [Gammaproteobacteria bacterium]